MSSLLTVYLFILVIDFTTKFKTVKHDDGGYLCPKTLLLQHVICVWMLCRFHKKEYPCFWYMSVFIPTCVHVCVCVFTTESVFYCCKDCV